MDKYGKLLRAAAESDNSFRRTLREVLDALDVTTKELAERAGISSSTLYKIVHEERSPSLDILRKLLLTVRELEGRKEGNFIAVIAARHVLDEVVERSVSIEGRQLRTREYPATTVEFARQSLARPSRRSSTSR
jgi:predicted transcriptional regulator